MPSPFRNYLKQAGLLVVGGLLAAGGYGYGATTGGVSLPEVTSGGAESPKSFIADQEINIVIYGTGSTDNALRYAATCERNPLVGLSPSAGSASIIRLSYEAGNNPAGVGGDIYLTKNCNDKSTTGSTLLINDFCTASGCVSYYTTGTAAWNGAEYIKTVFRANPTTSYTGRIRATFEDIYGE